MISSNQCTLEEPVPQFTCQDVSCQSNEATEFPTQSGSNKGTQTKTSGQKIKEKSRVCEFLTSLLVSVMCKFVLKSYFFLLRFYFACLFLGNAFSCRYL